MLALLDVANRVWPKKLRTSLLPDSFALKDLSSHPLRLFPRKEQLSFSIFRRTPLDSTVRLALTTRERTPRGMGAWEEEPVTGSKVTTPPD